MIKENAAPDMLLEEATALADVVKNYADFGSMAHALRVARRSLNDGDLATDDVDVARKRLGDGQKTVALGREIWVAFRA